MTTNPNWRFSEARKEAQSIPLGEWLLEAVFWCLLICLIVVVVLNWRPYHEIAWQVSNTTINPGKKDIWLPFGLAVPHEIFPFLFSVIFFTLAQSLELLPSLLNKSRKFQRAKLEYLREQQTLEPAEKETDSEEIRNLRKHINRLNIAPTRILEYLRLGAYTADLVLCLWAYPVVDGGALDTIRVVLFGQWQLIQWGSVVMVAFLLFALELMIQLAWMFFYFKEIGRYVRD